MINHRSKKRIADHGEVFTPPHIVEEMLDLFPKNIWQDSESIWLEPTCGNGNFIVAIIERRLQSGIGIEAALNTVFGMDIKKDNIAECRSRIDNIIGNHLADGYNIDFIFRLRAIVKNNIFVVKDTINYTESGKWHAKCFLFNDPTGNNMVLPAKAQDRAMQLEARWLRLFRKMQTEKQAAINY